VAKGVDAKNRLGPLLEGLLVTFLWSTSYVLVKIGLKDVPPLTFAAYRYVIASAILLAFAAKSVRAEIASARKHLRKLLLFGFSGYSVAQGLQCVGLLFLPAVAVTFILNFTPVFVLALGLVFLRETPTGLQLAGVALALLGVCLFFPSSVSGLELEGVAVTFLSGLGWAIYMVGCRLVLTKERIGTVSLTLFSMAFGAIFLLVAATLVDGPAPVAVHGWLIILWLSFVNTALAFVLWNRALRGMEAFKLSILQNTMLIQIAVLAWFFLGEELTNIRLVAMIMVFMGALLVQIRGKKTAPFQSDGKP